MDETMSHPGSGCRRHRKKQRPGCWRARQHPRWQHPLLQGLLTLACLVGGTGAQAGYSKLFLFGDSLSDAGNNAVVFDYVIGPPLGLPPGTLRTPVPTPDNSFVPSLPYATPVGGRYSNGPVWAETFAPAFGLSAVASNLLGTNYAYGGARMGPVDPSGSVFPPSLSTQVAAFLNPYVTHSLPVPGDALYVVAGGGNDARDSITEAAKDLASGKTVLQMLDGIQSRAAIYAGYLDTIIEQLEWAGAKNIVVWNTPNAGVAPAILAQGAGLLGTTVSQLMNQALLQALDDDIAEGVRIFDAYGFISDVAAHPGAYGLSNASDACSVVVLDPTVDCGKYFFWDGIHPTAAGHRLLANAMITFVPEPAAVLLIAIGLLGIAASRKSH
jgi:outer membrane lipase/esterase